MPDFAQPLWEQDVDPDPTRQFAAWFAAAAGAGIRQPEAAALATATADGAPSVRMVLVKSADERGFVFFTNYESRKGVELAANPRAALMFYWDRARPPGADRGAGRADQRRQESAPYVRSRPRGAS